MEDLNVFIERYKDALRNKFSYGIGPHYDYMGGGYGRHLIAKEYALILQQVYGLTGKQVNEIYDKTYAEYYGKKIAV